MFTWIPFYEELASTILNFRQRQQDLLSLLQKMGSKGMPVIKLTDTGANGEIPLPAIDPFSFYASFNRGIKDEHRREILGAIKEGLDVKAPVPSDFSGIPIVDSRSSWFFPHQKDVAEGDLEALWDLAEQAITGGIESIKEGVFARCLEIKAVGLPKLTVGLFWLRPRLFMPYDRRSREFFEVKEKGLDFEVKDLSSYKSYLKMISESFQEDFPSLSYQAWVESSKNSKYWQIAPGENARLWEDLKKNSIAAVGWKELDFDLTGNGKDELVNLIKEKYPKNSERESQISAGMLTNFLNLKPGYKFVTNKGKSLILGLGEIKGGYKYRPERGEYKHTFDVDYYKLSESGIPIPGDLKGKFGKTIIPLKEEVFTRIEQLFDVEKLPSFWIFQANPKYYDLRGALKEYGEIEWTVTSHVNDIRVGDTVFLWEAGKNAGVLGIAKVIEEPAKRLPKTADKFWLKEGPLHQDLFITTLERVKVLEPPLLKETISQYPELSSLGILKSPQETNFRLSQEEGKFILGIIPDPVGPKPNYSLEECAEETGFDLDTLTRWVKAINRKGQAIIYGPPGTGKTFIAEKLARHMIGGGQGFTEVIQFHPSYGYEDFIQGLRPRGKEGGGLDFPMVSGRFLEVCNKARRQNGISVLIIDEINRANLSRVFGELMYLMEYRDKEVPLAGGGILKIPENIRILGTMNTADRSIALVDHALRRRFAFLALYPNYEVLEKYHQRKETNFPAIKLIETLKALNQDIGDPHYEVGISFFLKEDLGSHMEDIWRMEIEPYLEEYFFDQPERIDEYRWNKIKEKLG